MNNDMKKRLESYLNTDKLISVYTDTDDTSSFTLGFLIQVDDDFLLMNMVNKFGEEDGFSLVNLDDIFMYDDDKLYSSKVVKLFAMKNQMRKYIEDLESSAINNLLKYAQNNNYLVEVNEDSIGFVNYFSDDILELSLVDIYAQNLGIACIDIDNINIIGCHSKYFRDIEMLIQSENK